MRDKYDLAVIGGGAAGMVAAISAAHAGLRSLALFERLPRVGKKLLATGNGRCNLTNTRQTVSAYHGGSLAFSAAVLSRFDARAALRFFENLGLLCREEEEGRVYPVSGQANSVLDCLRREMDRLGIETRCDSAVVGLRSSGGAFSLTIEQEGQMQEIRAHKVILATGGAASLDKEGAKAGYELLREIGQPLTPLFPALCGLKIDDPGLRSLKGLRSKAKVALYAGGALLKEERGELQFNDYGLSGVCVMNLARQAFEHPGAWLVLDLLPDYEEKYLSEFLAYERQRLYHAPLEELPIGLMPRRLGQYLLKKVSGLPLATLCAQTPEELPAKLAAQIKALRLPISGTLPMNQAQVTAGGADLAFIDPRNLGSRKTEGLYIVGEALDVDGDCGGYNLQWAWATGYIAGRAAAEGEAQ